MGYVLKKSAEYLNGFHRYISEKRAAAGRPSAKEALPLMQDSNAVLNSLPPVGERILLYDTYSFSDLPGALLYDRYETDIGGTPIAYYVRQVTDSNVVLERTLETYNEDITLTRTVPCRWFTSGHCGWITCRDYYKRKQHEKTT